MAEINGRQIHAARVLLRWDQRTLAARAKVARGTVQRIEQEVGTTKCREATASRLLVAIDKESKRIRDEYPIALANAAIRFSHEAQK